MMKLYGVGPSRWLRVQWALNELGVECELARIDLHAGENMKPDFLRLNPAHKVPVLVDGDQVITESAAIVMYLAEKYPGKGLMPADIGQRAQVHRWTMFAMTELEQPLWRIAKQSFLYSEEKRLPADIELAREDFRDMAKVLEQHMAGRAFIVGDRIGVADCVTVYALDWADMNGLLEGFPNLSAYVERMYARPAAPQRMAAVMAEMN